MLISVIIPVYKAEKYLGRCMDSILAQSLSDYELILVDDGSPDQSGAICDAYAKQDGRVRVIHQKNGGAAAARNTGLDAAAGEWIAFIDSDDWVHPDYLRLLYEAARQRGADLSACRYETVRGRFAHDEEDQTLRFSEENAEEYWVGNRIGATVPWGKLYRRELFRDLRYPLGRIGEDEFVTYRLLFGSNRLAVIDNVLYRYFVNDEGVSRSNYLKRLPDALEAFRQHEEYFKNSPWQKAYRLEAEYYAAAWSEAIWITKKKKDTASRQQTAELRAGLRRYMSTHKRMIPFEKRKDIYISAYPGQEWFIRGFGFLKQKLSRYADAHGTRG